MSINICVPPELLTDDDHPMNSFDFYERVIPSLIEIMYLGTTYLSRVYQRRIDRQMDDIKRQQEELQ